MIDDVEVAHNHADELGSTLPELRNALADAHESQGEDSTEMTGESDNENEIEDVAE